MRKEETIRKKIDQMRSSIYARFYAKEIAALEWAIGDCPSIAKRIKEVGRQYGIATD